MRKKLKETMKRKAEDKRLFEQFAVRMFCVALKLSLVLPVLWFFFNGHWNLGLLYCVCWLAGFGWFLRWLDNYRERGGSRRTAKTRGLLRFSKKF